MSVRVTTDPTEFLAITSAFLEQDPVLHTLLLSNVAERAAGTHHAVGEGTSYYVSVHAGEPGDAVIGAAMRTPGRPVYIGVLRPELAGEVAEVYAELVPDLTGVWGERAAVVAFAARWAELRGGEAGEVTKGIRLHELGILTLLGAEGRMRPMAAADVQLVADWELDGFGNEELADAEQARAWAEQLLHDGTLWIWELAGVPVSMAGHHLPIFGVVRVGPVYTPPEHRRHGYAAALTGELTAQIIANGNRACLFTDLANPTSNKIYAQLGYRPVADFVDVTFAR